MGEPEVDRGVEVTVYSANGSVVGYGTLLEILGDRVVVQLGSNTLEYPVLVPREFICFVPF